jgi:hypothetical protein
MKYLLGKTRDYIKNTENNPPPPAKRGEEQEPTNTSQ